MAVIAIRIRDTREALDGALVYRYRTEDEPLVDGLPGHEGAFLPCSFWLVDHRAPIGRVDALANFEELLAVRNDLGLLAGTSATSGSRCAGGRDVAGRRLSNAPASDATRRVGGGRTEQYANRFIEHCRPLAIA